MSSIIVDLEKQFDHLHNLDLFAKISTGIGAAAADAGATAADKIEFMRDFWYQIRWLENIKDGASKQDLIKAGRENSTRRTNGHDFFSNSDSIKKFIKDKVFSTYRDSPNIDFQETEITGILNLSTKNPNVSTIPDNINEIILPGSKLYHDAGPRPMTFIIAWALKHSGQYPTTVKCNTGPMDMFDTATSKNDCTSRLYTIPTVWEATPTEIRLNRVAFMNLGLKVPPDDDKDDNPKLIVKNKGRSSITIQLQYGDSIIHASRDSHGTWQYLESNNIPGLDLKQSLSKQITTLNKRSSMYSDHINNLLNKKSLGDVFRLLNINEINNQSRDSSGIPLPHREFTQDLMHSFLALLMDITIGTSHKQSQKSCLTGLHARSLEKFYYTNNVSLYSIFEAHNSTFKNLKHLFSKFVKDQCNYINNLIDLTATASAAAAASLFLGERRGPASSAPPAAGGYGSSIPKSSPPAPPRRQRRIEGRYG